MVLLLGSITERLLAKIQEYSDIAAGVTNLSTGFQVRQDHWQLAQLGQSEYSHRIQKRFVNETEALGAKMGALTSEISSLKANNDRYSRKSVRLSRVTIGLAFLTIALAVITVWLANRDLRSDKAWQQQQIDLLQEQIRVEKEVSKKMDEVIAIEESNEHK